MARTLRQRGQRLATGDRIAALAKLCDDFAISPMPVGVPCVGFDQHEPRSLWHVSHRKCSNVVATECVSDQNIGSLDTGVVERAVQLLCNAHARAWHRTRIAEARSIAIIPTSARPLAARPLHDSPDRCPVLPT